MRAGATASTHQVTARGATKRPLARPVSLPHPKHARIRVVAQTLMRSVALTLLFGLGLACGPAFSQTKPPAKDDARERLQHVQDSLRKKRQDEQGLSADISQIQAEREQLNLNLIETARQIQFGEGKLTDIEDRLGELEAQEKLLRGSLAERHGSIARLLSAMQRMGRDPPPVVITRREDALVMVRSAMMLASSFPQLKDQALSLASRLEELARVMADSRSEGEKLRAETQRLTASRIRLSELMEAKRQSLHERRDALDRVRREAAEIARNVTDLSELIEKLDKVVARQTGMPPSRPPADPSPETPLASAAPAAGAARPGPGSGGVGAADGTSPQVAIVMEPSGSAPSSNAGRLKPAMPFASAKGRLPLPVQGKQVIGFGDKAHTNRSSGIVLETRSGAQVVSPADGWIVFAGVFRSYGQILIINGGDGYHMLLAGLSQIDVQLGQFVLAGEPVGLMSGSPGGAKAKQPSNAAVLYVELRKDGRSIDPDPWWATEGTKKVQG